MAEQRILILTNHFFPENFKVNDVAFELAKNNSVVTVLTGIPNYPHGRFYTGYGIFKERKEIVNGVKVIRVPLVPRGKDSLIILSINYLSYAFFLTIWTFVLALSTHFDAVLVHHTSPVFLGIPAVMVKKIQRIKLYFWNLDLWPESVTETTGYKNRIVIKQLEKLVRFIYRNSDKLLISSMGFKQSVINKGVNSEKIIYFPNWAEDIFVNQNNDSSEIIDLGLEKNSFTIMFAGNIGKAQDMENVFSAIIHTSKINDNIKWLFLGEGSKVDWLKSQVSEFHLDNIVYFLGYFPLNSMPSYFRIADVMLFCLKDEPIFSYTVPAKIQAYMASRKPILAMINGEGAKIINEAKCGLVCDAGNYRLLTYNALKFFRMSTKERDEMGENGYNYYQNNFSKEKAFKILEKELFAN